MWETKPQGFHLARQLPFEVPRGDKWSRESLGATMTVNARPR